jgi:glycosyltransferase involved in cell wall biosynthesis
MSDSERPRKRLLLADRVKGPADSFLRPLVPLLRAKYDVRLVSSAPGDELARAAAWADLVWIEWCWDHAVWLTRSGALAGKPCIVRLHSVEALQTDYPAHIDWSQVARLVLVSADIGDVLAQLMPGLAARVPIEIIPNGIDLARFAPGRPDRRRIAWVGHVEPKKNPMLLLQIAHRLHQTDPDMTVHVAGAFTDIRTTRYLEALIPQLGLERVMHFEGAVADMPAWYADKGVLLSTSMYESFGLNIGEAMAVGAFPVVHAFPGAARTWPEEVLFSTIDEAVALVRAARPGLYREWVGAHYGLDRQTATTLALLEAVEREAAGGCAPRERAVA